MEDQSNRVEFLRALAAAQGIEPSADDLVAVLGFLDTILPELERLEGLLEREEPLR
jgi:hypothetical protein